MSQLQLEPMSDAERAAFEGALARVEATLTLSGRGAPISSETRRELMELVAETAPIGDVAGIQRTLTEAVRRAVRVGDGLYEHPEVSLARLLRWLHLFGEPQIFWYSGSAPPLFSFVSPHRSARAPYDLQHVADSMALAGLHPRDLLVEQLEGFGDDPLYLSWGSDATWPYFERHLDLLASVFEPNPERFAIEPGELRRRALDVLACAPTLPEPIEETVWRVALGPTKTLGLAARRLLRSREGVAERALAALGDKRMDARAAAARWLVELAPEGAAAAIEKAFRKEKKDVVRVAMLDALTALGVETDRLLPPEVVRAESAKVLKKGVPEALAWFPFAGLPELRWANGAEVPPEVPTAWIVQAHKLKQPTASTLQERYAALLDRASRESLGAFVLDAWIEEDLHLPPVDPALEARLRRQARAAAMGPYASGRSEQAIYEMMLKGHERTRMGSAIKHKGLLALAGACGGEAPADRTATYLKEHYGWRAAQCKALVQMLAACTDDASTQVLLSTSMRFRTAGIRKEAEVQVRTMAERRGWTVDELADRTIPTLGFESDGTRRIEYIAQDDEARITRRFVARLGADSKVVILDEGGERLKTLPEPRVAEDPAHAKAEKTDLGKTRREVKKVDALHTRRLFDAMCSQRAWTYDAWDRFLWRHPIMRRRCESIVWSAEVGDATVTFLPLDEGALTSVEHEEVTLSPDALIRVAHESTVGPELAARWADTLGDFQIIGPFVQFGRPLRALGETERLEYALEDRAGYLLSAFQLRGMAQKLSYERGPVGDGGWVVSYRKAFPSLGVDAHIEHSGSPLPMEDLTVAITAMRFLSTGARAGAPIRLGDLPPILVSEVWHDMDAMASRGSGFAADWKSRVGR